MRTRILWLLMPLLLAAVAPAVAAQFTITTSSNAGGTILPVKGKILVDPGGTQDVTFQANDGYYLAKVMVNKTTVVPVTDPKTFTYHFAEVQQNNTIAGTFTKDPAVTVSTTAGGTITPAGKVSVPYGTNQLFSIQANTGYHIQDVLVDKISQGPVPSYEFDTMILNHSLKGVFTINTYPITITASPGGKIVPAPLTAKHGQKITLTVTPDKGMMITGITVNDAPVVELPAAGPYKLSLTVTSDTTIAATFGELRPSAGLQQLQGTYHIVSRNSSFGMSSGGGNTYVGENLSGDLITGTFDGKGGCTIKVTGSNFNKSGDGTGNDTVNVDTDSNSPTTCKYEVPNDTTNGAFTLTMGSPGKTETVALWVSADGNTLFGGGPSQKNYDSGGGTDYRVETVAGVKAGSGMTKSSLAGTYHLVSQEASFWKSGGGGGGTTFVSDNISANNITATFDGIGGCVINNTGAGYYITGDNNGQSVGISNDTNNITGCTYTITTAGGFTLTMASDKGKEVVSGWASADGNAIVVGGPSQKSDTGGTGYRTELTFGVRSGSGPDNSALSGTFQLIGANLNFQQSGVILPTISTNIHANIVSQTTSVSTNISGDVITASFDGSGGCAINSTGASFQVQGNGTGGQSVFISNDSNATTSCTYTVTDGFFTLNMVSDKTEAVSGWVSADGNTVVVGGPSQQIDQGGTGYKVALTIGTRIQ